MCIIRRITISPTVISILVGDRWDLFELNSQMAPSLSQIHVLSTLTMLSFALKAREECTGHKKPWF